MSDQPAPKPRGIVELKVLRTEWRTPHMIRVVLGGDGLTDFRDTDDTDRYVKLLFAPEGVTYPEPFCLDTIQRDLPREQWPVRRTYTVRHFSAELGEMFIDFVYHGDEGLAGPWAASAQPGDVLRMVGPGGKYAPSPDADWHLLIGDDAAIPAIAAALERIPAGTTVKVLLQVANPDEQQKFETAGEAEYTWIYRDQAAGGDAAQQMLEAVKHLEFPPGQGHLFVHGEAEAIMKRVRPHLLNERGINRDWLSISGYWRSGNTEESFRNWKAAQKTLQAA